MKNINAATKIEFKDANKTDAAEQSLEIFASLLNLFLTFKSTIDSIEVFNNSSIKTEKIVEIIIIYSLRLHLKIEQINNINAPNRICIRKLRVVWKQ